ncbi:MAG: hypothetical protein EZS28_025529 [Streblomastix strix]|uniref:Uncharacterized protein n=1 Tax=Streblomastix strix TaxID=222440 RepID=A0A5J4V8X2_9EUKA|nr:MAG: hypothetical protein EZS28_025529 [Streblomastix strix]
MTLTTASQPAQDAMQHQQGSTTRNIPVLKDNQNKQGVSKEQSFELGIPDLQENIDYDDTDKDLSKTQQLLKEKQEDEQISKFLANQKNSHSQKQINELIKKEEQEDGKEVQLNPLRSRDQI